MSYTVGCYCCTCKPVVSSAILEWDPACRNHGAHGLRACAEHKREAVNCDCGCGYRVRHQDPDSESDAEFDRVTEAIYRRTLSRVFRSDPTP